MKDSTRSILRYTRDILIILIVLVALARTGTCGDSPDRVTDFIIDATQDLFSGRVFSSFSGFLSDIGDFFLRGGSTRRTGKNWNGTGPGWNSNFERTGRNLLHLGPPDVRRALPIFTHALARCMPPRCCRICWTVL